MAHFRCERPRVRGTLTMRIYNPRRPRQTRIAQGAREVERLPHRDVAQHERAAPLLQRQPLRLHVDQQRRRSRLRELRARDAARGRRRLLGGPARRPGARWPRWRCLAATSSRPRGGPPQRDRSASSPRGRGSARRPSSSASTPPSARSPGGGRKRPARSARVARSLPASPDRRGQQPATTFARPTRWEKTAGRRRADWPDREGPASLAHRRRQRPRRPGCVVPMLYRVEVRASEPFG